MDQAIFATGIVSLLFFLAGEYSYLTYRQQKASLRRYLQHISITPAVSVRSHSDVSTINKHSTTSSAAARLVKWASRFTRLGMKLPFPHSEPELLNLLSRSGLDAEFTPQIFLGLKVLFAASGMCIGLCFFVLGLPFAEFGLLLFPLAGFIGPVLWLNRAVRKRQETLTAAMPDFLDVMAVSLLAGASLENALYQTAGMFQGPLQEEFYRLKREMELGQDRNNAWKRLMERNSSPDVCKLGKAVLQSASLGVSVSEIFQMQAEESRRMRIERAKQRAAKASPKITLVTTVVMAPAVLVMILGLLLLNVFYNPQGLGIEGLFK